MAAICRLPQHLVNKIAAGEVIERPSSIVKELVENSLDAGSTRIDVAVEDGGHKLIAVSDNGGGMGPEDLSLAFASHATSKIAGEEDLYNIGTMGFRGEALASVASISHAHIRTCRRSEGQGIGGASAGGFEVEASGETIGQVRPCPTAPGTTVTVRDLFFNTPARRKFLRSAGTEFGHVSEMLARLALPHPQTAFTLTHNGRVSLKLPAAATTLQRVADLFGAELADGLIPIAARKGPVDVAGLIAPPAAARATAKWQYFFLNGRFIRDRLLGHALREAYRGLLDPNRSPVAFIFLRLPPAEVDVNVHPTKIEVRFRDSQLVYGEVLAALRGTLNRVSLAPTVSLEAASSPPGPEAGKSTETDDRRASIRQALADFFKSTATNQPRLGFPHAATPPQGRYQAETTAAEPAVSHPAATVAASTNSPEPAPVEFFPSAARETVATHTAQQVAVAPAPSHVPARAMQVHDSYIVAPCEDGLMIVDQHALHERLIYNDLRRRLSAGRLAGQRMLIPQQLTVTASEADILERRGEMLGMLGIEVTPFGPSTVAIQQFPSLLAGRGVAAAEFLRELLDRLADDDETDPERLLEDLLEMLACKAAVKAGQTLTAGEIDDLMARRQECEKGSSCPHGRPTTLKLTLRDLEKQFKRT